MSTIIIALNYERFCGVLGLIVNWFAALLGLTALPLLFGLLPPFKSCGPGAAIASIAAGLTTFVIGKQIHFDSLAVEVGLPTTVAGPVFTIIGLATPKVPEKVIRLINSLKQPS